MTEDVERASDPYRSQEPKGAAYWLAQARAFIERAKNRDKGEQK